MAVVNVHILTYLSSDFDLRKATYWCRDANNPANTRVRFIDSDTEFIFVTSVWEAAKTASLNATGG